jgi:hypothetical protein
MRGTLSDNCLASYWLNRKQCIIDHSRRATSKARSTRVFKDKEITIYNLNNMQASGEPNSKLQARWEGSLEPKQEAQLNVLVSFDYTRTTQTRLTSSGVKRPIACKGRMYEHKRATIKAFKDAPNHQSKAWRQSWRSSFPAAVQYGSRYYPQRPI